MTTTTNKINLASGITIDESTVDALLPFSGATVWVWYISKQQTGYGHWRLTLEIEVNGSKHNLTHITTDSQMIDDWNSDDDDRRESGINEAIEYTLRNNEDELQGLDKVTPDEVED